VTAFWILWAAVGGVCELVALWSRRRGDTLSENVWSVLRVGRDSRYPWLWYTLRSLTAAVCLWLAGHFAMGWWTL